MITFERPEENEVNAIVYSFFFEVSRTRTPLFCFAGPGISYRGRQQVSRRGNNKQICLSCFCNET